MMIGLVYLAGLAVCWPVFSVAIIRYEEPEDSEDWAVLLMMALLAAAGWPVTLCLFGMRRVVRWWMSVDEEVTS